MKRKNSGVRWRPETGYELRCNHCRTYWPLSDEFWQRSGFTRCKACWAIYKRQRQRLDYHKHRERRVAYQRTYRVVARDVKNRCAKERYWADPETERAKARERYYANREVILARKKASYAAKKAAIRHPLKEAA